MLVINKTDKLAARGLLLPFIGKIAERHSFSEIVPISAAKGHSIAELVNTTIRYLPIRNCIV